MQVRKKNKKMFDTKILGTDEGSIAYAAKLLSQGEVVGMPTETVYGLSLIHISEPTRH